MSNLSRYLRQITRTTSCFLLLILFCVSFTLQQSFAVKWTISSPNSIALNTSGVGFAVSEMSGVTYLGPSPVAGKHRFLAVQDNGNGLVTFDAAFNLSGNIVSAEALNNQLLNVTKDFEGIVQVGDSIFLSEENGPGVRKYNSAAGNELLNVSIPSVFTMNRVNNRGFESLAYDQGGTRLWTANEEALSIDGSLATSIAGTTVRLLELGINNSSITAGSQFVYEVEPIHGSDADDSARSGLSELVSLPDGTLIGLERSAAVAFPAFNSKVFEINFSGATDVSEALFDTGLIGETYTAVGKELLWSGAAGGGFGQNLEGLTVGPRLPNGDWILLGVVDDGDSLSNNTIVALQASPLSPIAQAPDSGDFDQDADIDGADFLAWQRGFGVTTLAGVAHGDGNHSGTVTSEDLTIWQSQYGSAVSSASLQSVHEPTSLALLLLAASGFAAYRRSHSI